MNQQKTRILKRNRLIAREPAESLRTMVEDIYGMRPLATDAMLKAVSNRPGAAQRKRAASWEQ
ncbi:MAG: hypothetical protein DMG91_12140 [Acidobacteria bacterium]|nr:MAG: hypothetical protein DMG91_12140 [Acidobacteriota bacterium]